MDTPVCESAADGLWTSGRTSEANPVLRGSAPPPWGSTLDNVFISYVLEKQATDVSSAFLASVLSYCVMLSPDVFFMLKFLSF